MEGKRSIYYALGQLAYAIAKADGKVQMVEREELTHIISEALGDHNFDFGVAEIIFHVLDKDDMDFEMAYSMALADLEEHKVWLNPDIKADFIKVVEKIALSYGGVHENERKLIKRFKKDIEAI
ncbi:MAG: TerB family tellurite resistance protein [Flavobacteriales bacterium]|nr:TerB family tellurite resistance protein [Flavobacteriales bacterium]